MSTLLPHLVTESASRFAERPAVVMDGRSLELSPWLPADERSPAELAVDAERRALIDDLCDSLPPAQSEALVLHCALGFTVEEVAEASQVPQNTIRSRLRLAKEALRTRITKNPVLRRALEEMS